MTLFHQRCAELPFLGIGVSTEFGAQAAPGALDIDGLHAEAPDLFGFLEVGVEAAKGLDSDAGRWVAAGRPTTYHFLDINLDEPEDFEPAWLASVMETAAKMQPAWMCGDAGLWHFGPRDPAHMLLLPPVLTRDAADRLADGIVRLRAETGYEVLPENPPGVVYVGDMHLLDFFARVCERADTGMLLDCAHLAIYQRVCGHGPADGLDGFPLDRVIEVHVAGGAIREHEGYPFVEDDHGLEVLPDTWTILDEVAGRAAELRAVVFECERNGIEGVRAGLNDLVERLEPTPFGRRRAP